MRRLVPRVVLSAAVSLAAAGCAAGAAGGAADGPTPSSKQYQVLVPDLRPAEGVSAREAERLGAALRARIDRLPTHGAIRADELKSAMTRYSVERIDSITGPQLAQQLGAELVVLGTLSAGAAGSEARARVVDVLSGDRFPLEPVAGKDAGAVADGLFAQVERTVGGLQHAIACNQAVGEQQYDAAVARCDSALAVVPRSSLALTGKAAALTGLERWADALAVYERLVEAAPLNAEALLGAGVAARRVGKNDRAADYFRRFGQAGAGDPAVLTRGASRIAQAGDFVTAYEVVRPAIEPQRGNAEFERFLFALGSAAGQAVQREKGKEAAAPYFETALSAYRALYASDTVKVETNDLRQAIAITSGLGRTDEALRMAKDAVARHDTVAGVWSQYAQVLSEAGRHAEAVQALDRVVALDPAFEDVYVRRAMAHVKAGARDRALADLETAASRGNRDNVSRVLYRLGAEELRAERFAEASELLDMAVRYADGDLKSDIAYYLGYSLYKRGEAVTKANTDGDAARAREALGYFQKALEAVRASTNQSAGQIATAAQQYIEYQQSILGAGRGG